MASKPQAYSGKQVPFSSENEVCRQAHFIKSPPPQLFSSQASWKSRYFILSKTEKNCYSLQYFKDHQYRGAIGVDEISSIEVGISNQEKMALVQKMFKCLPGEVMSIITPKRDYFLISKDWRTIDDWVSFISSSCLDLKDTHQNVKNPNLVNQDARNEANVVRPFDSGGNQNIYEIIPEVHDEVWEIDFSEDKRPASHPDHSSGSSTSLKDKTYSSLPRNGLPDVKTAALTRSHAVKLKTLLKQHQTEGNSSRPGQSPLMSDLAPENQQETEDENHYLSPRNVLAQLDNVIASNEDKEFAESKEPDQVSKPTDHLYMSMKSRNIPAGSPLEKVDVFLSKKDINKYLTFTQAMGHICVTQWEGAPHLGCIFHHGDRLSAVNDLKPHTLEEAGLFLDRSLGKEVKLTICRIPGSDKFHTRACACS
ncbi:pleckstrin homology domain-containing family S member 1 isoform X1 [Trichosurus vulpecula]|uniref:pleckstrin homology domain-containing family S member 1 isoform X1 n=1 Tax=Trichosurus vulpecula TaxID=9337 RepID=UPI00186ADB0E|nr:pleckstrin homology domain-containing family S member 1 isoform X1 [Trichosurus vulpecula]